MNFEERLKDIDSELEEIRTKIDSGNIKKEEIKDLETRIDELQIEKRGLLVEIEKKEKRKKFTDLALDNKDKEVVDMDLETREFTIADKEYRSAFLKQIRGLSLNDVEKRAFTTASSSAGAAIPTETSNEIIKKVKANAPLLDEITLLHVNGRVTFAVEGTKGDAALHTENAAITATTDTLTSITLDGYEIVKLVQISKSVMQMSIDTFEQWLTDMIAEKIAENINKYLILGTGSSQPQGIDTAATWGENNSVTVTKTGTLTAANVQTLIGLLPAAYDKNAKFIMSKKTLFTDFMPLQDNSKNKLVTNEGNNYFVYGYPVLLNDEITLHEAYLGDFKKVVGNLAEDATITSGFDINTNSYKFLGSTIFDSKVAIGEAFVKLVKATA